MSLGFVTLGVGLGALFSLTKHIKLLSILRVAATTLILGGVTVYLGKVKDNIKQGSEAMLWMSLGIAGLGLGLGVLFSLTKNIEWEQMAMIGVSMVFLGGATVALGVLNKSGLIIEGAIAMAVMS